MFLVAHVLSYMARIIPLSTANWEFFMSYQGNSSLEATRFNRAPFGMTKHAGIRIQQRGVNRDVLDCLLAYGRHEPDHKGCHVVTFDGEALEQLSHIEPRALNSKASGSRNLYAIVDGDGVLVTAGHRFRRVPRDLSLSSLRPGRSRSPRSINSADNPFRH
jgi:hypothetical protein